MFDFLGDIIGGIGGFAKDVFGVLNPVASAVAPYASAYGTLESVRETNAANERIAANANSASAAQAELNRSFQQGSADKQMYFQEHQIKGQQEFNADQAQRQMDFQERMSNTSFQRAAQDLSAAGFNPMLSLMKGGASSPNGASASSGAASGSSASGSMGQTHTYQAQAALAQAINTGMAAARLEGDLKRNDAEIGLIKANTRLAAENEATSRATGLMHAEQGGYLAAQATKVSHEIDKLKSERAHIDSETALKKFDEEKLRPAQLKLLEIETRLQHYQEQGAANRSSAAGNWYGRNIQPYLHDILGTGKAVGTTAIGGALMRK